MKQMTEYQRKLAEDNITLVDVVIRNRICVTGQVLQEYEDYYQVGCEALCRAATKYDHVKGEFTPFAKRCIFNAMVDHNSLQKRRRGMKLGWDMETDVNNAFAIRYLSRNDDAFDKARAAEITQRFWQCKEKYKGVARRGMEVLELKEAGYTTREIAEVYATNINNINAWISRSRKKLAEEPELMKLLA